MKIHGRRTRWVALALSAAVSLASLAAAAQREPGPSASGGHLRPARVWTAFPNPGGAAPMGGGAPYADRGEANAASLALPGPGSALALTGVPTILGGLQQRKTHMSEKRMGAGIVFTLLAAVFAGAGAAGWAAGNDELAIGGLGAGGGLISIGLPLLVSGAPPPEPGLRSPAMAYAGYALFGLSIVGVTAGVVGILADDSGPEPLAGLDAAVRGATAMGFGLSLILTGIPLVAVGSQAPAQPPAQSPALAPPRAAARF